MTNICAVTFAIVLLVLECSARPLYPLPSKTNKGPRQPLQTTRPFNIAHRGSNGELPEETAPAYLRAIEEGADFIETDILSSKDGVLICFHDVTLDETTDVTLHKEFADRKRTYDVQGVNTTGFFPVDFTWKELQTLRTRQRYPFRDQKYNGKFPIITFEEFISIALDAPRVVGIYPEIKNPVFINQHILEPYMYSMRLRPCRSPPVVLLPIQAFVYIILIIIFAFRGIVHGRGPNQILAEVKWPNGKCFEDMFVDTLEKYGYKGSYLSKDWLKQPAFIQSFAPTSLVYTSNQTDLPKILLIDDVTIPTQDTNQSYWEITSDAYFNYIRQYVVGIGPWKDTVVPAVNNYLQTPTDLVARAHAHDLQVHPYTYRNENQFLHFDFHQDAYNEYGYWLNHIRVDGLFTDFTGSLHNYQEWTSPLSPDDDGGDDVSNSNKLLHKIAKIVRKYYKK